MRAAAPVGLSAGWARSAAVCVAGQQFPSRPPESTAAGAMMLLKTLPTGELQKCSLQAIFCSGVGQRKLYRLLVGAAAGMGVAPGTAGTAPPGTVGAGTTGLGGTWARSTGVRPAAATRA